MNLTKLFNMQRELDEHIEQEHPRVEGEDRLAKKVLALQVELGELANEWRGFKFWSNDQKPRTIEDVECPKCKGYGFIVEIDDSCSHISLPGCTACNENGVVKVTNPLLEEYVDCLHFILSIGLSEGYDYDLVISLGNREWESKNHNVTDQFNELFLRIAEFSVIKWLSKYDTIVLLFIGLGELLGFTWEQIEQAYIDKNTVNHERQLNGY